MEIDRHMSTVHDLFMEPAEAWMPPKGLPTDRSGIRNLTKMTPQQLEKWHAAFRPRNEQMHQAQLKGDDLVRWKYQRYIKNYLRCVRGVDDSVGRLMEYLKQAGLEENTIDRHGNQATQYGQLRTKRHLRCAGLQCDYRKRGGL